MDRIVKQGALVKYVRIGLVMSSALINASSKDLIMENVGFLMWDYYYFVVVLTNSIGNCNKYGFALVQQ